MTKNLEILADALRPFGADIGTVYIITALALVVAAIILQRRLNTNEWASKGEFRYFFDWFFELVPVAGGVLLAIAALGTLLCQALQHLLT